MCNDKGWVFYEDDKGYLFQKECECGLVARQRMQGRLRFANIPKKYEGVRLKDLKKEVYENAGQRQTYINACKAIKKYLERFDEMREQGIGLYFFSDTKGSGKTFTMAALANELMHEKNIGVKFCTSLQILDELKATWDKQSGEYESEHSLMDALVTAPILIIDDFGTENVSAWVQDKFYQIVNRRYNENKITMFTSNMTVEGQKYDARITNRILEKAYIIPFPEESVREHIANKNREGIA